MPDTAATPWRLTAPAVDTARVPAPLVGVLQARIDLLAPPQRRALQQASVVGRHAWDTRAADVA